ncbi:UNVERIFIED_CONTAM: hypothetical protein RKD50_009724 [Streptomyces canus]
MEGEIGWFRRNLLVPVPEVASLAELNVMIEQWDAADERRRIGSRPRPVSEYFTVERPLLHPLPGEPFETGRLFSRGWTVSARSVSAPTATRCRCG